MLLRLLGTGRIILGGWLLLLAISFPTLVGAQIANPDPEKSEVVQLAAIIVTPSQFGVANERATTNVTLTSEELAALPQLGEDLYRTIGRLPGLATDDISAEFWVRGAPNNQVLSRFDGVDLFEPFHLKDFDGTLSIIDLQTIQSVNLMTGGFTVDYGDRLAGVLSMETQSFAGPKPLTTLGISVTDIRATNQGSFAQGDGQWMVAVRRGYIDLAERLAQDPNPISPTYYDVSCKLQYKLTPDQTVSLHVLYADDSFQVSNYSDLLRYNSSYTSGYAWARWQGSLGAHLSGETVLSLSRLTWHTDGDGVYYGVDPVTVNDDRSLTLGSLRQDWTYTLADHVLLRGGFEAQSGEAHYEYLRSYAPYVIENGYWMRVPDNADVTLNPCGDYTAAFLALRLQPFSALVIEPGIRWERHSYTGDSAWSPRLNSALTLGPRTTVRAAWGLFDQAQGLQDVAVPDGQTSFYHSERAEQRVLSFEHRLELGVNLRAEVYERLSSQLHPYYLNASDPFVLLPETRSDLVEIDPLRGRARGFELVAESRGEKRFGWSASYALARSEELVGDRWMPVERDQTQTFYADFTYVPASNWQLSSSWQYHTGWPTTDVSYSLTHLADGSVAPVTNYGPLVGDRLPAYNRLDFRATRRYRIRHGELRVFVDLFNVYGRKNVQGYTYAPIVRGDTVTAEKDGGGWFPFLPSAGVSWEF
ncbi:MAG: TonB-dependent receptor plug domain-containing protein [Opitutaceae bacterium]